MKKGMLNALTLVLCLVNLVLTVILVFTMVPTLKQTSTLVNRVCEVINLDIGNGGATGDDTVTINDLKSVNVTFEDGKTTTTINLNDGKHLVKVGVSLNLNSKHDDFPTYEPTLGEKMSIIDDIIISTISSYSFEDASNPEKKNAIANAVLKKLQNAFGSTFIYSVSFFSFTVQ